MAEFEWLDNPKISDINEAGKAIRNRYNMSDENRAKLLAKIVNTALDPNTKDRAVIAAARTILAAEQIDIARDKLDIEKAKLGENSTDDILTLARELKNDNP